MKGVFIRESAGKPQRQATVIGAQENREDRGTPQAFPKIDFALLRVSTGIESCAGDSGDANNTWEDTCAQAPGCDRRTAPGSCRLILARAEGIPDGSAITQGEVGTEPECFAVSGVIRNHVNARLGADKQPVVKVKPQPTPRSSHKVVIAYEIGTISRNVTAQVAGIKPKSFHSNAGHALEGQQLIRTVEVHGIEIPEDWTKGNLTAVQTLVDPPIDFALNSQVMPQQNVCARAKVGAATLCRQESPIEFRARAKQRPSP